MKDFFQVSPVEEVLRSLSWVEKTGTEEAGLAEASGRILAADVAAGNDIPHFARAVMDGYAVRASDTFGCSEVQPAYLNKKGVLAMGEPSRERIGPGETFSISTGGMMPPGADAVVMWEYAREDGDLVEIFRPAAPGEHVVGVGEDVRRGETLLEGGRQLRPADIGLLSGLGETVVTVSRRPRVAVVSTGDELVSPDQVPREGQVRNVNQYSLGAWIGHCGGEAVLMGLVGDEEERIRERVNLALEKADIVLISGGSSAGVRDLTRQIVEGLGEPGLIYHGLAIRPGKPTIIGGRGKQPVFGLPGHPVSAMVIFLMLVRPVMNIMLGRQADEGVMYIPATLADNLPSMAGREDFYQVELRRGSAGMEAVPVFRKSGLVSAMVRGTGMVRIPTGSEGLEEGQTVDVEVYG